MIAQAAAATRAAREALDRELAARHSAEAALHAERAAREAAEQAVVAERAARDAATNALTAERARQGAPRGRAAPPPPLQAPVAPVAPAPPVRPGDTDDLIAGLALAAERLRAQAPREAPVAEAAPRRRGRRCGPRIRRAARLAAACSRRSSAACATFAKCGFAAPAGLAPRPARRLSSGSRDESLLRPSPRPLRVLAARWRLQDRRARRACRRVRPAGARADRPRRDERRGRAVQGGQEARDQADRRLRDLLRRRSHRARAQEGRAQPPDADGVDERGLSQPRPPVLRRASWTASAAASRPSTWRSSRPTATA